MSVKLPEQRKSEILEKLKREREIRKNLINQGDTRPYMANDVVEIPLVLSPSGFEEMSRNLSVDSQTFHNYQINKQQLSTEKTFIDKQSFEIFSLNKNSKFMITSPTPNQNFHNEWNLNDNYHPASINTAINQG